MYGRVGQYLYADHRVTATQLFVPAGISEVWTCITMVRTEKIKRLTIPVPTRDMSPPSTLLFLPELPVQPVPEANLVLNINFVFIKFQDFTLDMYFRQFWKDDRLKFDRLSTGLEKLVVGAEYINLIWTPDTFFVNEKSAYFHEATTENQFLRILHDGNVLRSIR